MSRCYVQLGRYGDVMNMLPLLWEQSRIGERPHLLIGHEFDTLVEGCSYVQAHTWDGNWEDLQGAVKWARDRFDEVFVTQVHSQNYPHNYQCDSYAKDAWAQIGRTDWGSLPLVFDLRDGEREQALRCRMFTSDDPMPWPVVLVNLTGSSSVYSRAPELAGILKLQLGPDHNLVFLDNLKAHRLYDLLGLYNCANCLVTTDTATMHLAHASRIPVVALLSEAHKGWGATPRYPGQVFRIGYSAVPFNYDTLCLAIRGAAEPKPMRDLRHVYCEYPRNPDAQRRHEIARATWKGFSDAPVSVHSLARTSATIKDPRPVPFVNDLVEHAIASCDTNDLIVLTNDDISFAPGLDETLRGFNGQCGWAHRRDFKSIHESVTTMGLARGHKYPGIDFFVFTPQWWKEANLPLMYLGRNQWDMLVKAAMQISGGYEIPVCCAHEQHPSFWSSDNNENTNPANLYNRRVVQAWFNQRGLEFKL